jgi:hypothetical protein
MHQSRSHANNCLILLRSLAKETRTDSGLKVDRWGDRPRRHRRQDTVLDEVEEGSHEVGMLHQIHWRLQRLCTLLE